MNATVRSHDKINRPERRKSRAKPRKNRSEVIRHDLKSLGLAEDTTHVKRLWRSKIKVADFR